MNTNPYSPPSAALAEPAANENNPGASKEQRRGGCLTVFLAIGVLGNTVAAGIYANTVIKGTLFNQSIPGWAVLVLLVGCIANVVACAAVWKWQRWGVYAFFATSVFALFVNLSLGLSAGNILVGLIGPAILLALVRPIWKFMR